jgi:hypothetical protein
VNCTFADNHAVDAGGAVEIEISSTGTFTNCIFWGNTADVGASQISVWDTYQSYLNVYYCDVEGGENGITPGFQGNYEWNINEDPEFLGPLGGEPYYAIIGASCINEGTLDQAYLPQNWICPPTCLCGNQRVYGSGIDLGCYETLITGMDEEIVRNSVSINVFPNPINSNPTIEIQMKKETPAQILILDIHGKVITKLKAEELKSGNSYFKWNAERLSPGIYFCQLKMGSEILTRKVVKIY